MPNLPFHYSLFGAKSRRKDQTPAKGDQIGEKHAILNGHKVEIDETGNGPNLVTRAHRWNQISSQSLRQLSLGCVSAQFVTRSNWQDKSRTNVPSNADKTAKNTTLIKGAKIAWSINIFHSGFSASTHRRSWRIVGSRLFLFLLLQSSASRAVGTSLKIGAYMITLSMSENQ